MYFVCKMKRIYINLFIYTQIIDNDISNTWNDLSEKFVINIYDTAHEQGKDIQGMMSKEHG